MTGYGWAMVGLAFAAVWLVVKLRELDQVDAAAATPACDISPAGTRRPGPRHYCVCPLHERCECGLEAPLRRVPTTNDVGGSGWEAIG